MTWAGRILMGLVGLFLLADGTMKALRLPFVIDANNKLGYPEHAVAATGLTLVVFTILYLVPRTSVLGAILLAAYLGGATAIQVRAGAPLSGMPAFDMMFPSIIVALAWVGLACTDSRVLPFVLGRR